MSLRKKIFMKTGYLLHQKNMGCLLRRKSVLLDQSLINYYVFKNIYIYIVYFFKNTRIFTSIHNEKKMKKNVFFFLNGCGQCVRLHPSKLKKSVTK